MSGYKVASGNKYFSASKGVLFNKKKTSLVAYPFRSKATSYTIPKSVKSIEPYAFSTEAMGICKLKKIIVPTSVPARNNPGYDNLGGYSPILIELSDTLPWQAFLPKNIKHPH